MSPLQRVRIPAAIARSALNHALRALQHRPPTRRQIPSGAVDVERDPAHRDSAARRARAHAPGDRLGALRKESGRKDTVLCAPVRGGNEQTASAATTGHARRLTSIAMLVPVFMLAFGCSSAAFDVADPGPPVEVGDDSGIGNDFGSNDTGTDAHHPGEIHDTGSAGDGDVHADANVESGGDAPVVDGKDGDAGAVDTGDPTDTGADALSVDGAADGADDALTDVPTDAGCPLHVHDTPLGSSPHYTSCLPTGYPPIPSTYTAALLAEQIDRTVLLAGEAWSGPATSVACDGSACTTRPLTDALGTSPITWCTAGPRIGVVGVGARGSADPCASLVGGGDGAWR